MIPLAPILIACSVCIICCLLIQALIRHHIHFSGDHLLQLPQKIHIEPIPRVGGLAIFFGLIIAAIPQINPRFSDITIFTIGCALPGFLIGTYEDITKKVGPIARLFFIGVSATLAIHFNDILIHRIDVPVVDRFLQIKPITFTFTIFSLTGISNAYNISDGLNGLASFLALSALIPILIISYNSGDSSMVFISALILTTIISFLFFNFPFGKIFLGDGGAYFIGLVIGIISILLVCRNPGLSPWIAIVINIYPIIETLFSIYRRARRRITNILRADSAHLHSLIFIRLQKYEWARNRAYRNPAASLIIAMPSTIISFAAVYFCSSSLALFLITLFYFVAYLLCHKKLSTFKKM